MVRSEDGSVQSLIQGKQQLWESEKWYKKMGKTIEERHNRYTPEQVANFVVPDIKDLLGYADAVRQQTLLYLKNVTAKELDRKPDMTGRPAVFQGLTVAELLMLNITHFSGHAGEISYLRGLQRGMDK